MAPPRRQWEPSCFPDDPTKMRIPLTRGLWAVIDTEDVGLVRPYAWQACPTPTGRPLAMAKRVVNGVAVNVAMHRLIIDAPPHREVDHWDGDKLNNCKANLRVVTNRQNQMNRRVSRANANGFKGVTHDRGKWNAKISDEGRRVHIGRYATADEAAMAYDTAARRLFGVYARLNFPGTGEMGCRQ